MNVFKDYAVYYDALYSEKDYNAECDFIETLFQDLSLIPIQQILDLGCGTGGHAIPLALRGYQVTGIDLSNPMLESARMKADQAGVQTRFQSGDVRNLSLDTTFDAVIAMFAVVSYQTTNEDLVATFKTARRHLQKNSLFIFDSWFGPAVLAIRPTDRVKTIKHGEQKLIRTAESSLDVLNHTVTVNYTLSCVRENQVIDEVNETHVMRFLFLPEVELLCQMTGFELIYVCPFMEPDHKPSEQDWNVTWVARAH